MKNVLKTLLATAMFALFLVSVVSVVSADVSAATLVDPNEIGFGGKSRDNNYDTLMDAYFSNTNVVTTINGIMWVPWYKTSSGSAVSDLQSGANCNSGQTIDYTHNCMVTDEYSQIGVIVAMGKDQNRMNQFYNTVLATKSKFGNIPAWRIYRDGNTIQPCRDGINGNCDTASDATARIVIALFTASKNSHFTDSAKKTEYATLAKKLADDMLTYETDKTCKKTAYGDVCHWLAGGSQVRNGGLASNDYAYTGYYADAIIAMLAAYSSTGDVKYYNAAKDFTLNYMQAAKFDGAKFTAPPGKAFKWTIDSNGQMKAVCTSNCNPVAWEAYDASRALGMCQANYYAKQMGVTLPQLSKYCELFNQRHMSSTTKVALQYYPDGNAASSPQNSVFAQGLQALHFSGVSSSSFKSSLDSALSHYTIDKKTFDYAPSIGVYTQSIAVRALGMGIGRDAQAFKPAGTIIPTSPEPTPTTTPAPTPTPVPTTTGIASLKASAVYGTSNIAATVKSDVTSGVCRTVIFSTSSGDIKILACQKENNYVEIYKQAAPSGLVFKACLANGCITKDSGFVKFIPTTTSSTTTSSPTPTTSSPAPAPSLPDDISELTVSNTYNSVTSRVKSDVTSGTCRTVVFETSNGDVKIMGCEKDGNNVEVYRQAYPDNFDFKACMATACVDRYSGFAKAVVFG
ncbi:MAG TPA: hypothetical protein VEC16_06920 [Alphaproteobacteria bacterium]|nr:hypothetical protein [Alphaproteobacteria bacterium]